MFLDHFVSVFLAHDNTFAMIVKIFGRTVAPVMCFFIAEGYHYTSNLKKYISRLLIFALISHIPYNIAFGYSFFQATSVMWPLALGLIALAVIKHEKLHILLRIVIVMFCCALAWRANWNFVAVLWVLGFGIFQGKFALQIIAFTLVGLLGHISLNFYRFGFFHDRFPQWQQLGIFLAIPLLVLYNGQRGRKSKIMTWLFYVFYPAHLLLLFLLNRFTSLADIMGRIFS